VAKVADTGSPEAPRTTNSQSMTEIGQAAQSSEPVSGLTHNFYRYPARFSPTFARAVIRAFTQRGDTVFDPFMGGGTTLVEAAALGRKAIGTDINPLSLFVTKAKTIPLSEMDIARVQNWAVRLIPALNLRSPAITGGKWAEGGYQRNIGSRSTWPIRKTLGLALGHVSLLRTDRQRRFARCALLRTGQWALDCRATVPSAKQFREQFLEYLGEMIEGTREYARALNDGTSSSPEETNKTPLCVGRSAIGIETDPALATSFPPALILTSPPYPGVHVLYHRWQVRGRRETPAPFWIVGSPDGNGSSYYTFGDRKCLGLESYYDHLRRAYHSLARIASTNTVLVQLVAFTDPSWQLPRYLGILQEAGFEEMRFDSIANSEDGRIWREVPHRKWHAALNGKADSAKEVVLIHRAVQVRTTA